VSRFRGRLCVANSVDGSARRATVLLTLATGLDSGLGLRSATEVAVAAAAYSVGTSGVVPSLPRLSDLAERVRSLLAQAGHAG
jgi:hypothetical protein